MNDNNLNNNEQNNQSISVQTPSNNENANVVEVNVDFIDDSIENRLMESEKNVEENTQVPVNTINENTETNQVVVDSSFQSNEPVKQAPENNQGEVFVSFNNEQPTVKNTSGVENNGLDEYLDKYKDSDYQNYLKEKKRRESRFPIKKILKVLLKIILFGVIAFGIYYLVKNYKNIFGNIDIKKITSDITITGDGVEQVSNSIFVVNKKVDKITVKYNTVSTIEKSNIKIYSGSLNLFDNKFENIKKWDIELSNLSMGMNVMELHFQYNKDKEERRTVYLYNKSEENVASLDKNDDDKDGLLNYQEIIYGTNKKKADSDGDGLSDYYEVFATLSDPLKANTNGSKKTDSEADFDKDGLTNKQEENYKTNPYGKDSDGDGLSDYDEIFRHKTNPLKKDSDSDGMSDKDEIEIKSNPTVKNSVFNVTKKSSDNIFTVQINNIDNNTYQSLNITKSNNIMIDNNNLAYISGPYNVEMDGNIKSANISFKLANNDKNVSIYYINSEKNTLEEVKTTRKGDIVSANVNHFSEYIVLDKEYIDNVNKLAPKVNEKVEISTREYIVFGYPILISLFNRPIHVYEINGDKTMTGNNQEVVNREINERSNLNFKVEFGTISRFGSKVLKKVFGWLENSIANSFKNATNSDDYKSFLQHIFFYKKINGSDNLIKYLFGEEVKNIKLEEVDEENKNEDANKDGIPDYYVKLMWGGKLTTYYGTNPFKDADYEEIQKNNDFDKDGLKNGDEIKVVEENGSLFIIENSSPVSKDSDNDGLDDLKDASPLIAFNSQFKVGNKLSDSIELSDLEEKVQDFNSLFNTGNLVTKDGKSYVEYNGGKSLSPNSSSNIINNLMNGITTSFAALGGFGYALDAHNAWVKYYDADAKPYTEEDIQEPSYFLGLVNDTSIYGSPDVQRLIKINVNKIIEVAEQSIKDGNTEIIESNKYLIGAGSNYFSELLDSNSNSIDKVLALGVANINTIGFLNNASAYTISEISRNKDNYKMKLRYVIADVYDWKNSEECDVNQSACFTEVQYFNKMLLGKAKGFLVKLEYDLDVEWSKGNKPKITLLDGTPYKGLLNNIF